MARLDCTATTVAMKWKMVKRGSYRDLDGAEAVILSKSVQYTDSATTFCQVYAGPSVSIAARSSGPCGTMGAQCESLRDD